MAIPATVSFARTEHQVKPHEGFAPSAIALREERPLRSEDETNRPDYLARPPEWTRDGYMPCVPPRWFAQADQKAHMDQWDTISRAEARELCEGCPVMQQCLEAAMAEEGNSKSTHRFLVRGGLTAEQRALLWEGKDHLAPLPKRGRRPKPPPDSWRAQTVECEICGTRLKNMSLSTHNRRHRQKEVAA